MQKIIDVLEVCNYRISRTSESVLHAAKDQNDMVRCEVNVSIQDINGMKYFAEGWLLIREVIGEETFWTSVGREIGPNGMFPTSSHFSGGWSKDQEVDASISIQDHLLKWLETHSQLANLIAMIENLYFEGEKIPLPTPKPGFARTMMAELGFGSKGGQEYDVIFSPQNSQFLANLHYRTENYERALFYINQWIEQRGAQNVDPAYHRLRAEMGRFSGKKK